MSHCLIKARCKKKPAAAEGKNSIHNLRRQKWTGLRRAAITNKFHTPAKDSLGDAKGREKITLRILEMNVYTTYSIFTIYFGYVHHY